MNSLQEILQKCKKVGSCLEWTGSFQYSGKHGQSPYPNLHVKGKTTRGNRAVWAFIHGKIPKGICICHTCDNTKCLNPKHLFAATHSENMQDKIAKGRDHNLKKTHCSKGHPFSGENLYVNPSNGRRACKICGAKAVAAYDEANREKRRVAALARYYRNKEALNG